MHSKHQSKVEKSKIDNIGKKHNYVLLVISPTAPPNICGVSDYSYHIAHELSKSYVEVNIGLEMMDNTINKHLSLPIPLFRWKKTLKKINRSKEPTDVLLNYTPTSYSFIGFPLSLIIALYKFKGSHPENRFFLFVHETWNGNSNLKFHHLVRDRLTKWSISKLSKIANGIAVVTEEQKIKMGDLLAMRNIHLSPIGANILPIHKEDGLRSIRKEGRLVVFGLAHTRLWTLQMHMPLLKTLYAKGFLKQLRAIGPIDNAYGRQEASLIAENLGPNILLQLGSLEPAVVSLEFCSATAALVGQTPDNLLKSGSFAALSAHAVPVICNVPSTLLNPPSTSFFSTKEVEINPNLLTSEEGESRRRNLHKWFWENRSWEAISKDMINWMSIVKDSN